MSKEPQAIAKRPVDPADRARAAAEWSRLCDTLKREGLSILDQKVAADGDQETAEGLRTLIREAVFALELKTEFANPDLPRFYRFDDDKTNWGAPNAQNTYLVVPVRGDRTYRVRINSYGRAIAVGGLWSTSPEFLFEDDGAIEIIMSATRQPGNWFPLSPAMDARRSGPPSGKDLLDLYGGFPGLSGYVMFKTYYEDWSDGKPPAEFQVECLDDNAPVLPVPLTLTSFTDAISNATDVIGRVLAFWDDYLAKLRATTGVNKFTPPVVTPVKDAKPGVSPSSPLVYGTAWFELQDDEVLLVESEVPTKGYWSFQLYSRWWEGIDYLERQTSLNHLQSHLDSDGKFRAIVSAVDPGIPNWLDTGCHHHGAVMYRWINSDVRPTATCKVVKRSEAAKHLPKDHPHITPDQRKAQIVRRRRHFASRFQR